LEKDYECLQNNSSHRHAVQQERISPKTCKQNINENHTSSDIEIFL